MDQQIDLEVAQIMAGNLASFHGKRMIAIVEEGGKFIVHRHTSDSVCPPTTYKNEREAAARVLQLLQVGPVWPQTWPEDARIG